MVLDGRLFGRSGVDRTLRASVFSQGDLVMGQHRNELEDRNGLSISFSWRALGCRRKWVLGTLSHEKADVFAGVLVGNSFVILELRSLEGRTKKTMVLATKHPSLLWRRVEKISGQS